MKYEERIISQQRKCTKPRLIKLYGTLFHPGVEDENEKNQILLQNRK